MYADKPRRSDRLRSWFRDLSAGTRKAWAWAQRRHLPALLSVVLLALLLVAERKLLKDVLHAQEGLNDALGDLKHTVDDELGEARSALQDTRTLERDIRSRLDALHGRELSDVPVLARALKDELDAGVGRARGVADVLGVREAGRGNASLARGNHSVQEEVEMLASNLVEARGLALDLAERARRADEALGAGSDGGVSSFPDVRAQATRIAQRLSEAESVMFYRPASSVDPGRVALAKDDPQRTLTSASDTFPPLYARARELSLALDRSYARMFGDGGIQDASELTRKLQDIQARLQSFQLRLDRIDASLRVEEAALPRRAGVVDAGTAETRKRTGDGSTGPALP
jgi:hypothetical protein